MLVDFKVKNVLSFKDLQEFSMVAGSTIRNSERLYKLNDYKLLKFSSIYGANASGKSNFVKALFLMQTLITNGFSKYNTSYYYRFTDKNNIGPSYFEAVILIDDNAYSYGFEVDFQKNEYASEWLIKLANEKEDLIFERDFNKNEIKYNKEFGKELLNKLSSYNEDIIYNKHELLLTFLNNDKPSLNKFKESLIFSKVYNWFSNNLNIASPNMFVAKGDYSFVLNKMNELSKYMESFDTGIVAIKNIKITSYDALSILPLSLIDMVKESAISSFNLDNKLNEYSTMIKYKNYFFIIKILRNLEPCFEKIYFYHDEECMYPFNLNEESDGTERIFELAAILLTDDDDKIFVVDELDRCLHPKLTIKFISMFLNKVKLSNQKLQLIVTTHESRLLDFDLLRRDEIWFVEKKNNVSNMYSLEEFNVRFDKKIDKAYLEGRFGGIPNFIKTFDYENKNK